MAHLAPAGEKDLRRKVIHTSIVLLVLLSAGILFVMFAITSPRFIGSGLLWAFAALGIGLIGGFLFAIPRATRHESSSSGKTSQSAHSGTVSLDASSTLPTESHSLLANLQETHGLTLGINTNLEDISDWLTKMIVGIGLVELRSIPGYVVRIGHYVASCLGSNEGSLGSGIVLYFLALGLLSSYLLTRMFVSPAFLLADQATHNGVAYDVAQTAIALTQLNGEINGAIEELTKTTPISAARVDQLINLLQSQLQQFPLNRRLHIILGRLYRVGREDYRTAIRILSQFADTKRRYGQLDTDYADALFNIACYCSILMGKATDEQSRSVLEADALKAIKESVDVNKENVKDFQTDPDLSVLRQSDAGKKFLEDCIKVL